MPLCYSILATFSIETQFVESLFPLDLADQRLLDQDFNHDHRNSRQPLALSGQEHAR